MREKKLDGWSDLLASAYRGRKGAVVTLLEKKGDPNETDNLGRTALIHAAAQGHEKVVEVLIEAGTDVFYSPSTDGRTALHWAAFYGHRKCCDLLQAAGCDVEEPDNNNHSAQELAVLGGAEFLLFAAQDSMSIEEISTAVQEAEMEQKLAEEEREKEERAAQEALREQEETAKVQREREQAEREEREREEQKKQTKERKSKDAAGKSRRSSRAGTASPLPASQTPGTAGSRRQATAGSTGTPKASTKTAGSKAGAPALKK